MPLLTACIEQDNRRYLSARFSLMILVNTCLTEREKDELKLMLAISSKVDFCKYKIVVPKLISPSKTLQAYISQKLAQKPHVAS